MGRLVSHLFECCNLVQPSLVLTPADHARNNLPDALRRWRQRDESELARARTKIGLANLTYNIRRLVFLRRPPACAAA